MLAEMAFSLLAVACPLGRACASFDGQLNRGERLSRPFGPGLMLVLEPMDFGWEIVVRNERGDENLARLTPPLHFVPHPRYIQGWHFRNADNSGPNDGSVNAPQEEREFVFGRRAPSARPGGTGRLFVKALQLSPLQPGQKAHIERLEFSVTLSWPASWSPRRP
jgi:hypothetical protein